MEHTLPIPTREELWKTVEKSDPRMDRDTPFAQAAVVMLAALYFGTGRSLSRIAKHTGIDYAQVQAFAHRLRKAWIWRDGITVSDWAAPGRSGATSFWLDVGVACGIFEKLPDGRYQLVDSSPSSGD